MSIAMRQNLKLSAKYYGPYKALEKIRSVAYRLLLHPNCNIDLVFHVSLLKKKTENDVVVVSTPPLATTDGQ